MFHIMDYLYDYWIGLPNPDKWPEYVLNDPVQGHGRYSFQQGLVLGLLLFAECAGIALKNDGQPL